MIMGGKLIETTRQFDESLDESIEFEIFLSWIERNNCDWLQKPTFCRGRKSSVTGNIDKTDNPRHKRSERKKHKIHKSFFVRGFSKKFCTPKNCVLSVIFDMKSQLNKLSQCIHSWWLCERVTVLKLIQNWMVNMIFYLFQIFYIVMKLK